MLPDFGESRRNGCEILLILALAGGLAFGYLQGRLLIFFVKSKKRARYFVLPGKLILWGGAMILMALWSALALICFVIGATAAMMLVLFRMYRRAKEE